MADAAPIYLRCAGLSLWYGGNDTPAPHGDQELRDSHAVIIGVAPAHAANVVSVRYRVDGERVHTIPATRIDRGTEPGKQYFRALFPRFFSGERVEYLPVVSCAGRQTPGETTVGFPSSFRLCSPAPLESAQAISVDQSALSVKPRYPLRFEFLCFASTQLQATPEVIGETPESLKVDWFVAGGTVSGPRLRGTVRPDGGDWMTIRPDGIGILDIHATWKTEDGALIDMNPSGVLELGAHGYQDFLQKRLPERAPLTVAPRFLTAHPKYQWLNRLQCFGVGEVNIPQRIVAYDIYYITL